jgi:hypothetical protein
MYMKIRILLVIVLAAWIASAKAQQVKTTSQGNTCQYCKPDGWELDAGSNILGLALSDKNNWAGLQDQPWGPLPDGPEPSHLGSFLSALFTPATTGVCHTTLTGLQPFKTYYLRYNIMATKKQTGSSYPESGTLQLSIGATESQTTTFTPNVNTSKWIPKVLKFTTTQSTVRLTFSGSASQGGYVNLDIGFNAISENPLCPTTVAQVKLSGNSLVANCAAGVDLNSLINEVIPPNIEVMWFTNPSHSGFKFPQPTSASPGTYYAFKYSAEHNCFNTDNSSAVVTVTGPAQPQVQLSSTDVSNTCPYKYVDLNSLFTGSIPSGAELKWFTNSTHTGNAIQDFNTAGTGTYYAFFYFAGSDCYNTDNSTSVVNVKIDPPVPLKATSSQIICPATSSNLVLDFFGGFIPPGAELKFFTNPTHTGLPLGNTNVGEGTYYAFYYYAANNCYNQDVSTAKIEVSYQACADLTTSLDIDGLSFAEQGGRDFVVNIFETRGTSTNGNISFRITKIGAFDITYPTTSGNSSVLGNVANENSKWSFSENANFITATSSSIIPGNGQAVIGFHLKRKSGISKGLTQNVTATILTNAGGDTDASNNSVITSVSTN